MDKKEKGDEADLIRLVEDEPQEVVRLDAPKKVRVEKKGLIAAESLETRHRDAIEAGNQVNTVDLEADWLNGESSDGKDVVPMGWFFLLGAALLGIVAWAGYQVFASSAAPLDDDLGSLAGPGGDGANQSAGTLVSNEARESAAEHFEKTEEILRGFLGASNFQERAKYVRHPERVTPLMEDYYSRNEFEPIEFRTILKYQIFPLENLPFLALQVEDEDENEHAILLEDGPDGILVDWESFVCFQPIAVEKYVSERPLDSTILRAYVSVDYFHSYEFESREEYSSFRLSFRHSEERLNGYVKRGTELDQKFRKLFPDPDGTELHPLILQVRFLEDGRAQKAVLIEDLKSTIWAYPRDPAEVASSE